MTMHIFIKTLSGKRVVVDIESNDTIQTVKQKLCKQIGNVVMEQVYLIFAGKLLVDFRTINYYNISKESTLHAMFHWLKYVTNHGHVLWSRSKKYLLEQYNIPNDYCQITYPADYDSTQKLGCDENPFNEIPFQLNILPPADEIAFFIHYISYTKECKKYVFINRNEPLYKIGYKLQFYSPFYMNDKRCLELHFMEAKLDVYKTPNDYSKILCSECTLNAKVIIPANTIRRTTSVAFVYVYMHMISSQLEIHVPDAIVQIINWFYNKHGVHDRLLFCMDEKHGINMFDTSDGKRFQMKVHSMGLKISDYRFYGGYFCTASGVQLSKSMQSVYTDWIDFNGAAYDAIFHCGYGEINCKLLMYDSNKLGTDVNIDGYDIQLPNMNVTPHDDNSVVYDPNNNSFYIVNYGISKLDLNWEYMKWNSLKHIKVMNRHYVSLLCDNNNLFIIGGVKGYACMKEIEMIDTSFVDCSDVIKLPEIPIDVCQGKQSTYIEMNNQIAVGYQNVNILDLQKEKWIIHKAKLQCLSRNNYRWNIIGDCSSCMWNDSINNNIIYIATAFQCVEWIDIRENTPKWNILWNSSFEKLIYRNSSFEKKDWRYFAKMNSTHKSVFT